MKRFLILLIVAAGGVAWASLSVPSNAAVVNGQVITQGQVNADVSAIAASAPYFCYLNAESYEGSQGQQQLPAADGVGQASEGGAHTASTSAFVASYLETAVGHQLIAQLAAQHHVHLTSDDLSSARSVLEGQISSVEQEVAGQPEGCSSSTDPITGAAVLKTLPAAFVAEQVRFIALVTDLEEDISGIGSSTADLERYFHAHPKEFESTCFTVGRYATEAAAQADRASVYEGASFATLAAATGLGNEGCPIFSQVASGLPTSAKLGTLPVNTVSSPIAYDGDYLLVEFTRQSPVPFKTAEVAVKQAAQEAGAAASQAVINRDEVSAHVDLDPRYGVWHSSNAQVVLPPEPKVVDVLNAPANSPAATTTATTPASG